MGRLSTCWHGHTRRVWLPPVLLLLQGCVQAPACVQRACLPLGVTWAHRGAGGIVRSSCGPAVACLKSSSSGTQPVWGRLWHGAVLVTQCHLTSCPKWLLCHDVAILCF